MTCPKCYGYLVNEYGVVRCVNCGWRENKPLSAPIEDDAPQRQPGQCVNCHRMAGQYKHCDHCIEVMREYRRKKKEVHELP
jgi:hypothetical protein